MDILTGWLKDEVKLDINNASIEDYFSSGYAFGELLHHFNLQPDFESFDDSGTPDAKINNFTRLQLTLSKLKIKIDSNSASAIMTGEKGVAAKYIYDIKIALDSIEKELLLGNMTKSGKASMRTKPSLALLDASKNDTGRLSYTNKMHEIFEHNVRRRVPDPGVLREALHLQKFSAEKARQESAAAETKYRSQKEKEIQRKTFREDLLSKMSLRKQKGKELEDEIIRSHTASLNFRKQLERQEWAVESALSRKKEGIRKVANEAANLDAVSGIDDFENTLKRLGIGEKKEEAGALMPLYTSAEQQLSKIETMLPDSAFWNNTKNEYMNTVKARVSEEAAARKEREKKRKKLLLERQKLQYETALDRRKNIVLTALNRKSNQEEKISTRLSQLQKENRSIRENRDYLDKQNEERSQADFDLSLKQEGDMQKRRLTHYRDEVADGQSRWKATKENSLKEKRKRREAFARDLAYQLVGLAGKVVEYREVTSAKVPVKEYSQWVAMITSGISSDDAILRPDDAAEETDEIQKALDMSTLNDYLSNKGEWNLECDCELNQGLVSLITELSEDVDLGKAEGTDSLGFDLKIAVAGGLASGKSMLSRQLAEVFKLSIIDVDKLVSSAVSKASEAEAAASETTEGQDGDTAAKDADDVASPEKELIAVGAGLKELMEKGQDVPDEQLVKLIMMEISTLKSTQAETGIQGFVLDGFPSTRNQAALLEKMTTGLDLDRIKARKEQASKLAPPVEKGGSKDLDSSLLSGLDLVLRLNMEDESIALKRILGMRVDPRTGTMYHLEFDPPPEDEPGIAERLTEADGYTKDLSIIEARMETFSKEKEALDHWLKMFPNLLHYVDSSEAIEVVKRKTEEKLSSLLSEKKSAKEALEGLESATKAEEHVKTAMESAAKARQACEDAAQQLLTAKRAEIEAKEMLESDPNEDSAKEVLSQKSSELCQEHFQNVQKAVQESQQFLEEAQAAAEKAKESASICQEKTEDISISVSAKLEAQKSAASAEEASKRAEELAKRAASEAAAAEKATKRASKILESTEPEESPPDEENADDAGADQIGKEAEEESNALLSPEVKQALWAKWQCMEGNYIDGLAAIFSALRKHRYDVLQHFVNARNGFKHFISKPDKKQEILSDFQSKFNNIDDDLRRKREAKAELLLRADELCDTLWDICDKKKKEWLNEMEAIASDSFFGDHTSLVEVLFQNISQLEMDRLSVTCAIIHDFDKAKKQIALESEGAIDIPEFLSQDALPDSVTSAMKQHEKTLPAWVKEVEEVMPLFSSTLVAECSYAMQLTTSDDSELSEETIETLKKEQDTVLQRLQRLTLSARKYIEDLKTLSANMDKSLKEWSHERYVGECSAVSVLGDTVREAANQGNKLLYDLRLEGDQFIVDETVMTTKPLVKPDAPEEEAVEAGAAAFSVDQLQILAKAMKEISRYGFIRISDALETLVRFVGEHADDEQRKRMDSLRIHTALRSFDVDGTNSVSCNHLLICLILSTVPSIMTSTKREIMRAVRDYMGKCVDQGDMITKENFMQVTLWWEPRESESEKLKGLLFDVFEEEGGEGVANYKKIVMSMCTDHTVSAVLVKAAQIDGPHDVGPDGELIANASVSSEDLYAYAYDAGHEPLERIGATCYRPEDVTQLKEVVEDLDAKGKLPLDLLLVSSTALSVLDKMFGAFIYKDFFAKLRG